MGEPIDLFLPSKGEAFKTAVEPGKRFSPEIAIKQQRHKSREVRLSDLPCARHMSTAWASVI